MKRAWIPAFAGMTLWIRFWTTSRACDSGTIRPPSRHPRAERGQSPRRGTRRGSRSADARVSSRRNTAPEDSWKRVVGPGLRRDDVVGVTERLEPQRQRAAVVPRVSAVPAPLTMPHTSQRRARSLVYCHPRRVAPPRGSLISVAHDAPGQPIIACAFGCPVPTGAWIRRPPEMRFGCPRCTRATHHCLRLRLPSAKRRVDTVACAFSRPTASRGSGARRR